MDWDTGLCPRLPPLEQRRKDAGWAGKGVHGRGVKLKGKEGRSGQSQAGHGKGAKLRAGTLQAGNPSFSRAGPRALTAPPILSVWIPKPPNNLD